MFPFICPKCRSPLSQDGGVLKCSNCHSYDISRYDYVNLLQSQQSSLKRHGDDKLMVRSRTSFLEKGYYAPLLKALTAAVLKRAHDGCSILDAGCGEGWYTSKISDSLRDAGYSAAFSAVDISKDAVIAAAKRRCGASLAVASAFDLPVADGSQDILLSIFAPLAESEFHRVIKPGGALITAIPLKRHLYSLKAAVYDIPYENDVRIPDIPGFSLDGRCDISGWIHLDNQEDISALFMMTPYYYKTGRADQEKLSKLGSMDTELEFGVLEYVRES